MKAHSEVLRCFPPVGLSQGKILLRQSGSYIQYDLCPTEASSIQTDVNLFMGILYVKVAPKAGTCVRSCVLKLFVFFQSNCYEI